MLSIKINYSKANFDGVIEGLNNLKKGSLLLLREAVESSLLDIQTTAKRPGYVPYKTGTLKRSITHKVVPVDGGFEGYVGSNLPYARIQEFGGSAGRGGSVNIRGKKYLTRAIQDNEQNIKNKLKRIAAVKKLT